MKELKMLELMKELNSLSLDNPDNPIMISSEWPFVYSTNGDTEILQLFGRTVLQDPSGSKMESIEEISHELQSWMPALQSAIWAVEELIRQEWTESKR